MPCENRDGGRNRSVIVFTIFPFLEIEAERCSFHPPDSYRTEAHSIANAISGSIRSGRGKLFWCEQVNVCYLQRERRCLELIAREEVQEMKNFLSSFLYRLHGPRSFFLSLPCLSSIPSLSEFSRSLVFLISYVQSNLCLSKELLGEWENPKVLDGERGEKDSEIRIIFFVSPLDLLFSLPSLLPFLCFLSGGWFLSLSPFKLDWIVCN